MKNKKSIKNNCKKIKVEGVLLSIIILILFATRLNAQESSNLWSNGNMNYTIDHNNSDITNSFNWYKDGGLIDSKRLLQLYSDSQLNELTLVGNNLYNRMSIWTRDDSHEYDGITFKNADLNYAWSIFRKPSYSSSSNTSPDLVFSGGNETSSMSLKEIMRLNSNGRLGIGTPDPQFQIDVRGARGTIAFQNISTWDHMYFTHDGYKGIIRAGGAEHGIDFQTEASQTGSYKSANNYISKFQILPNKVETKTQNVTLNYGGANDLTKVSINTDKKIDHAALTIAGATYIGPKAELAAANSLDKFKSEYLQYYNLWVEDGIVTEDLRFANVSKWKDEVFKEDYDLWELDKLANFIKDNGHLPQVMSEKKVKKEGYSIKELNLILLQKVEELTLYTIQQHKQISKQAKLIEKLQLELREINKH